MSWIGRAAKLQFVPADSRNNYTLVFVGVLALACLWVWSLPVFPNQDGPMHLYYVEAIRHLLHGETLFSGFYQLRIPPPPYALHYALLYLFTSLLPVAAAEKLMVVTILCVSALGFRFAARTFGPNFGLLSIAAVPLFLSWPLVMGFHNYCLAVGLLFWAWGFLNQRRVALFCLLCLITTLTHAVPVAYLGVILFFEWLLQFRRRPQVLFIPGLCLLLCVAYIKQFVEPKPDLASPYKLDSFALNASGFLKLRWLCIESGGAPMLLHRVCLMVLFALAIWSSCKVFSSRGGLGSPAKTATPLAVCCLFLVSLPFIPQEFNGLAFFSNRMLLFVWLCGLIAAASTLPSKRWQMPLLLGAIGLNLLTLGLAERALRPIAHVLNAVVQQAPYPGSTVLAMQGKTSQLSETTTFDPYLYLASGYYLARSNQLLLNDPFTDPPNILPLRHKRSSLTSSLNANERFYQLILHRDLVASPQLRQALLPKVDLLIFAGKPPADPTVPDPLIAAGSAQWRCHQVEFLSFCESTAKSALP